MPFDILYSDGRDLSENHCKSRPADPRVLRGGALRVRPMLCDIESFEGLPKSVGEKATPSRPGVSSVLVLDSRAVRGNPECSDNREGKVSDAR